MFTEHTNGGGKYSSRFSTRAILRDQVELGVLNAYDVLREGRFPQWCKAKLRLIIGMLTTTILIGTTVWLLPANAEPYSPSGCLAAEQVARVLANAGFSTTNNVVYRSANGDFYASSAAIMTAIAERESGFCTNAKNPTSSATGLFQIMLGIHPINYTCATTAWCAAEYAFKISGSGTNFQPWDRIGCGAQAIMSQERIDRAKAAVASMGGGTFSPRAAPVASFTNSKAVAVVSSYNGKGYWILRPNGAVNAFGDADYFGNAVGKLTPDNPAVAMARTDEGGGYWIVARNGAVYTFGNAQYKGGANTLSGRKYPIMGIAPHGNNGYWLLGSDGGVFSFGSAPFKGSAAGKFHPLLAARAIVPTGDRQGYWIVNLQGAVYSFGTARYKGGRNTANDGHAYVGMAQHGEDGYWLLRDDGGVYSYGSAPFKGSAAGQLQGTATGMVRKSSGGEGYWITSDSGAVYSFGDARFAGRN